MRVVRLGLLLCAAAWSAFAAVPTPASWFGHEMGADRTVLDWDRVVSYFQALEKNSDRIRVSDLGKSTEGRPFIAAVISAPETVQHLDRYIEIQRKLADPRITPASELDRLAGEGKAIVLITCSMHSTELAATPAAIEFVYKLLTEDKPRYRAILQNTVFLLVPSLNPDGLDMVSAWYRRTLGTRYEGTSPPWLYQKYVGHDNNRDWYIFSQAETRLTVAKLHNVWHPQIVYDMHQQGPRASRMFVPPWMDPIEPNVDPILMQETNMIGTAMAADLTAAGKTGISIYSSYDFWTPARHYQAFHGGMRILTEAASARLASPITLTPGDLDRDGIGYNARERSWNHLEPWQGGTWRLRDIVDYELIAMESCLYNAAIHRDELLRNFYNIGRRAIARKSPWGFRIPARQRDPGATRKLLLTLQFGMVDIDRAANGDYVIPMAQPYSGFAKALLERQHYPDLRLYPGGPPKRPYDVTAHTLPLLMGVDVETLEKPLDEPLERASIPEEVRPALSASDSDAWITVNRAWTSGRPVWRNPATGDFALEEPAPGWKRIERPRLAVYGGLVPSVDEGWTRWILEQFEFAYTSLQDTEVQAGGLRRRFDVLVVPDIPASTLANGYKRGSMPEEFTGGLGPKGSEALREFVSAGGTLVFLNRSTAYALEHFGLKAKQVLHDLPTREFYCPGSLLNVRLAPHHPLTLGLPAEIPVWFEHSPAWESADDIAKYPDSGLLASGWLLGEKYLAGRSALVDARLGSGHVILFGMRPQYRAQSYQTLKLFFNALLYF